jgi:transcriptional regulator with XRE-family HTH domain
LARNFNVRFSGRSITVHAARKWLVGEAIPTQDKLRALAQWLGVSVEWLRFGGDATAAKVTSGHAHISSKDLAIIESLQRLNDQQRRVIRGVIRLLIQENVPE